MGRSKSSYANRFLIDAKKRLQEKILESTGLRWDYADPTGQGGSTSTGNVYRRLLHDGQVRKIILEEVPDQHRERMEIFGQRLSIIIRVMSSHCKVNVEKYKEFCIKTNLFLLREFPRVVRKNLPGPWISITPTVHKVLTHSWELILHNNSFGLANLDESGLEGNNKILRSIRQNLSRKSLQDANLNDTLNRLWLGSDPVVNVERLKGKPFCKHCNERGHSTRYCSHKNVELTVLDEDDTLFKSLCIN